MAIDARFGLVPRGRSVGVTPTTNKTKDKAESKEGKRDEKKES